MVYTILCTMYYILYTIYNILDYTIYYTILYYTILYYYFTHYLHLEPEPVCGSSAGARARSPMGEAGELPWLASSAWLASSSSSS